MKTFNILHLGDLHLPQSLASTQETEIIKWATETITDIASHNRIHLIVCTGDLGLRGSKQSLRRGFGLLRRLRDVACEASGPPPPVVVTPGNHDVTWPPSPTNFTSWSIDKRYNAFCESFQMAKVSGKGVWVRPNLKRGERSQVKNSPYWCSWADSAEGRATESFPPVFVLTLASPDRGGSPLVNPAVRDVVKDVLNPIIKVLPTAELRKKLFDGLRLDIPYIESEQLVAFERSINRDLSNSKFRQVFQTALRILVIHHPLLPFPFEQEYRPHDTPANGWDAVTRLQKATKYPFHLVLYGHRHKPGYHLMHGFYRRHIGFDELPDLQEMAFVCCGHLLSKAADAPPAFQLIHLERETLGGRIASTVKVAPYIKGANPRPEPVELIEIENQGHGRWISVSGHRLYRESGLSKTYSIFVRAIEREYQNHLKLEAESKHPTPESPFARFHDVDGFVSSALAEVRSFAEGPRGVTKGFIREMREKALAPTTRALCFVDYCGDSTWIHPNLVEFLAELLLAYYRRNSKLINHSWDLHRWVHDPSIERTLRRVQRKGTTYPRVNARLPRLEFEVVRILAWKKKSLLSPAGQTLIRLHDLFGVPLFWIDPSFVKKNAPTGYSTDFHLEWAWSNGSKNASIDQILPVEARPFDRTLGTRPSMTTFRQTWATFFFTLLGSKEIQTAEKAKDEAWAAISRSKRKIAPVISRNASMEPGERRREV